MLLLEQKHQELLNQNQKLLNQISVLQELVKEQKNRELLNQMSELQQLMKDVKEKLKRDEKERGVVIKRARTDTKL